MFRRLFAGLAVALLAMPVMAQPGSFIEMGAINSISNDYNVPDAFNVTQIAGSTIQWYRFDISQDTGAAGFFFDIDTSSTSATLLPDTEIGLYDNLGNFIATDDDDGHSLLSALSFGNTTPRTLPVDPFGFTNGSAANGRDGNLNAGSYWLAVGLFNTTFGTNNWTVTSTSTATPSAYQVNFRTDLFAIPEPGTLIALGLCGLGLVVRRRRV